MSQNGKAPLDLGPCDCDLCGHGPDTTTEETLETSKANAVIDALREGDPARWSLVHALGMLVGMLGWGHLFPLLPLLGGVKLYNLVTAADPPEEAADRGYGKFVDAAERDDPIRQAVVSCAVTRICAPPTTRERVLALLARRIAYRLENRR